MNEDNFNKDIRDFLDSEGMSPPKELDRKILKFVNDDFDKKKKNKLSTRLTLALFIFASIFLFFTSLIKAYN